MGCPIFRQTQLSHVHPLPSRQRQLGFKSSIFEIRIFGEKIFSAVVAMIVRSGPANNKASWPGMNILPDSRHFDALIHLVESPAPWLRVSGPSFFDFFRVSPAKFWYPALKFPRSRPSRQWQQLGPLVRESLSSYGLGMYIQTHVYLCSKEF